MFARRLIFGFVLTWFCDTNCQVNFFVAHKYETLFKKYRYSCVTNSSLALSWIRENIWNTSVSTFIPNSASSTFNCDIKDDVKTRTYFIKSPWHLKNSLKSNFNEIILDRRWEDMEAFSTEQKQDSLELKFQTIPLTISQQDFEIPLSIRTKKEAHIFLCDGDHPSKSNCYWFLLQAFDGKTSAMRKCKKGAIPSFRHYWARAPCNIRLTEKTHQYFPTFLSNRKWSHFKLTKNANHVSFIQILGNRKNTILEWTDQTNEVINVTNMIVNSRLVKASWKIHQVDYIYTNEETNKIPLGPTIRAIEGSVCISMFVSLCQPCSLSLALTTQNQTTKEKKYFAQNSGWSEIRFLVEDVQGDEFVLLVSTTGAVPGRFWAIDKVRQCRKNEFRMIALYEKATCQLMSDENILFDNSHLTTINTDCPEDTIGEFCVPCEWVYEDCEQISICSKDRTTKQRKCFCSAGFESDVRCYYTCNTGLYGHGCKNLCGTNCLGQCNKVNGTCTSCLGYYTGSKCDIALSVIFFANAPTVTDVKYTTADILVTNFELKHMTTVKEPLIYTVQYKEADSGDQNWQYFSSNNKFNESKTFRIDDLKADTKYQVRCVITTSDHITHFNDQIAYATFTTKCQEFSDKDVHVSVSDTSVNVSLIKSTILTCRIDRYSVYILDVGKPKAFDDSNFYFDKLAPLTNYTLVFQRESKKIEKTFQTKEISKVGSLYSYSDDNKELALLSLLLLIPVAVILFVKRRHLAKLCKSNRTTENEIQMVNVVDNRTYGNVTKDNTEVDTNFFSKTVKLENFQAYVKESEQNGEFERQHSMVLTNVDRKIYDTMGGSQYFDYIDMEYIKGPKISKAYIATEIPTADVIDDFWRAIWEENVEYILLLDDLKNENSRKYWPEKKEVMECGKILIHFVLSNTFPDYEHRRFVLVGEGIVRQVEQIHYSYRGLNPQRYIPLFKKLLQLPLKSDSPICIHSSDGLRETGLVLLCDMCLRMSDKERAVDVLQNLKRLSDHNSEMVDDIEHYKLAHFIISDYFFEPDYLRVL